MPHCVHVTSRVCSVAAQLQYVLKERNDKEEVDHLIRLPAQEVTMFSPRPTSASRASTVMEQELLQKIGLLAEHHARNVRALQKLRKSGWTAGGTVRRTGVSKDDSMMFCTPPAEPRRTFTRVATSAEGSWRHTPTVVEPFRSMETHTTAWKRKMRKYEEVCTAYTCESRYGSSEVGLHMCGLAHSKTSSLVYRSAVDS